MKLPAENQLATLIERVVAQTIEHVRLSGIVRVDPDELIALKEGAKARVYAMAALPFSEAIASDRALAESIRTAKSNGDSLTGKCAILETRLTNAREQTARLPEPLRSLAGIAISGVGLFSIALAPSIYSVFLSSIQDAILAWLFSILIGAAIGAFLVQILLQPRAEANASKHSKVVGFGLGIGFGILRLSRADGFDDYLIAIALTVLECVAVAGLDWFAEKHRQSLSVHRINDELTPSRSGVKAPVPLDNSGIRVVLCGFSGTVQDGSAANTDALLATWKGLFIEPVKFAPFCGVEPIAFSELAKPDSVNPISTAIVYQGGKAFNATVTNERPRGSNHLTVAFSRNV